MVVRICKILLSTAMLALVLGAGPAAQERLRADTAREVRARLTPLLNDYCKESCVLIDVRVDADEASVEGDDLGFEGVNGEEPASTALVAKIAVDVQVDDRVSTVNRDRLASLLRNNLAGFGAGSVDIAFKPVTLPQIGQSAALEEQLKRQLERQLIEAVDKVIETFCPDECVLSQIVVEGRLMTPDEAAALPAESQVRDKAGGAIFKVERADVAVAVDEALAAATRQKILNLLKARTRFVAPVSVDVAPIAFPESNAKKQERLAQQSKDPFGLEQLRQTLQIFRELAGTKEVVTTNTQTTTASEAKTSSNEARSSVTDAHVTSREGPQWSSKERAIAGGSALLVLLVVMMMVWRISSVSRDARMMVEAASPRAAPMAAMGQQVQAPAHAAMSDEARKDLGLRMKVEDLKDELVRGFVDSPRVAKETFSRLLQEEGVEETARYVHIFGHLVVFELLGDPNLQRELFELSEYYHKSTFDFTPDVELKLLMALRTRVTANEIRVLTRKQMDKFDFLLKLDATQIYNLIAEEKPQVQSIVLTQLDHKRRRAVFDMYQGEAKVGLMQELCRADAIPKEYLSNVAKALNKKVTSRPEFDTEHLRSSDILLDLLEKADLVEQRALMNNLVTTNADAARGIKLRLVTVEMMPYLRDGHLLEIMLGLERHDLLTFLAGVPEHIRSLVLSKAPDELANTWIEELEAIQGFDDQAYRLVEMKVLGRIRALANNGVIHLLDINDMIFGKGGVDGGVRSPDAGAAAAMVA